MVANGGQKGHEEQGSQDQRQHLDPPVLYLAVKFGQAEQFEGAADGANGKEENRGNQANECHFHAGQNLFVSRLSLCLR